MPEPRVRLYYHLDDELTPHWICKDFHSESQVIAKFKDNNEAECYYYYLLHMEGFTVKNNCVVKDNR